MMIHTKQNWYYFWWYVSPHFCPLKPSCMGSISTCNSWMCPQVWFSEVLCPQDKFWGEILPKSFWIQLVYMWMVLCKTFGHKLPLILPRIQGSMIMLTAHVKAAITYRNTAHTGRHWGAKMWRNISSKGISILFCMYHYIAGRYSRINS